MNKFEGFPSVHVISIEESKKRRESLSKKLNEYGISYKFHIFPRYYDGLYTFTNDDHLRRDMKDWANGPLTSHLLAIRDWYVNTTEPYAFFAEDDIDFSTSQYWNFTWKEFFNKLPKQWSAIQMAVIRTNYDMWEYFPQGIKLRNRFWCDWSLAGYMITRNHAEELLYHYMDGDNFRVKYCGIDRQERKEGGIWWALNANPENIIYTLFGKYPNYIVPLFLEDIEHSSTSFNDKTSDEMLKKHGDTRRYSRKQVLGWWKKNGDKVNLDEFCNPT